ncbi:hypothetical protein [Burkholderia gladioli]|uniref:hypothetical protein n=1 Tax=Burkholderia gladioli TaxID=28095 RepID=UPI0016407F6F|nr:hypothetical protein [Burkholderia gladioli]
MDFSLITGAVASLNAAREFGKAALAVRDFNESAALISNLNSELLKAQESLFAHNTQLLTLQQQYFEATQELTKVREALAEKTRYQLFEVTPGAFVYRAEGHPAATHDGNPVPPQVEHLICQQCFDGPGRRKVVLRYYFASTYRPIAHWSCPVCNSQINNR